MHEENMTKELGNSGWDGMHLMAEKAFAFQEVKKKPQVSGMKNKYDILNQDYVYWYAAFYLFSHNFMVL